jgi:hypothetical protein
MTVPLVEQAITQAVKIVGPTGGNVEKPRASMIATLGAKKTFACGGQLPFQMNADQAVHHMGAVR